MADGGPGIEDGGEVARSGRWLHKGAVDPVARMPLFGTAMDTTAELWTQGFCALAASEGEVAFTGLHSLKADELKGRRTGLPILASLRAPSWETAIALSVDRSIVSTVVEAFFGGEGDEAADEDDRPVSAIEMRIVDVLAGQAATALTGAMKGVHPTRFEFDRTLSKPDVSFLGKGPPMLLVAGFTLSVMGRKRHLDLAFPLPAVEAQGAAWGGDAAAFPVLDGPGWTRQLKSEVSRAELRVEAAIGMHPMSLKAITELRVGQVLELPQDAASTVLMTSGDERLFHCHLGQSAGFYTVRVDETVDRTAQPPRKGRRLDQ